MEIWKTLKLFDLLMHFSLKQKDAQNSSEDFWGKVKIFLNHHTPFYFGYFILQEKFHVRAVQMVKIQKQYFILKL